MPTTLQSPTAPYKKEEGCFPMRLKGIFFGVEKMLALPWCKMRHCGNSFGGHLKSLSQRLVLSHQTIKSFQRTWLNAWNATRRHTTFDPFTMHVILNDLNIEESKRFETFFWEGGGVVWFFDWFLKKMWKQLCTFVIHFKMVCFCSCRWSMKWIQVSQSRLWHCNIDCWFVFALMAKHLHNFWFELVAFKFLLVSKTTVTFAD